MPKLVGLVSVGLMLALLNACVSTTSPSASEVTVRKSPNDERQYRYIELDNKLRVLLVADATTDRAAAALTVYRGSFHEPSDRPGLAHFLEHMLFIQTGKYPEIDGFQGYISANGGSSNAYTAGDHTNYFFDIQPAAFDAALDRFGRFFIDPTLSAEYAEREKNAVHSEYKMQIKDDGWRGYMASKQALNPDHPASKFTIGNLDTLAGDIQADLKAFFATQYSADQMGLVVLADKSLDELEVLTRGIFGLIPNRELGPAHPKAPMYTPEQLPARLDIKTLKEGASLTLQFPVPPQQASYRSKPDQYYANLIGHEGEGSLYQLLRERGWIESLAASVGDFDFNHSVFEVQMELTTAGQAHQDQIIHAVLAYIKMVQNQPPLEWLYQEQARVAELGFEFQEKSRPMGFVYQMAPNLELYPPEDLLVANYLMERFDPELIQAHMAYLNPDNMLVIYASSDVVGATEEPWFSVPYTLTPGAIATAPTNTTALALPNQNPYLPENLALESQDNQEIRRIVDTPGLELWMDRDVQFGTPKANLKLELAIPGGLETPRDRALAQLYRMIVEDHLSAITYPAYLAGLGYNLGVPDSGFELSISGYDDKQATLAVTVIDGLLNAPVDADRFTTLKAALIREWGNLRKNAPMHRPCPHLTIHCAAAAGRGQC